MLQRFTFHKKMLFGFFGHDTFKTQGKKCNFGLQLQLV